MRVIKMNTHGKYEIKDIEKGIKTLREEVGGEIEGVTFAGRTDMILFVEEMGKADDELVNCLATMVILNYSNILDIVYGDAIICALDEEGNSCSLSDEQIDELLYVFAGNCTPEVVSKRTVPIDTERMMIMNMMKQYLGNEYSENHLRNFCLYWMKAAGGRGDEWRKENDLDCLYFDGDLRADTLMSAWTPIKWVADCLNRDSGIAFYKVSRLGDDPYHDLKLLADEGDTYLPKDNKLVELLDTFLELAEQRCNFILLPVREMNCARYRTCIRGKQTWLFDEVPATLSHIFDKDSLGRFFMGDDGEVDTGAVEVWIKRERLEMGFDRGIIDKDHVLPLVPGLDPYEAKWLTNEEEISAALEYMIDFLQTRLDKVNS